MASARRRTRPTLLALTSLSGIDKSGLDPGERAGLDAFIQGAARRWLLVALVTAVSLTALVMGESRASGGTIFATSLALSVVHFALSALPRSSGYRPSLPHVALVLDLVVLASPLVFVGSSGMALLLLLGLLPYTSAVSLRWHVLHCAALPLFMLSALGIHHLFLAGGTITDSLVTPNYLVATVLFVTGLGLRLREASQTNRITAAREAIERVASGALYNRIEEDANDDLGLMNEAINTMLIRITQTIADAQREAREVSAFAEMLSLSAQGVLGSTQSVLNTARSLADEMDSQRERAEDGHDRTADAAAAAGSLRDRADRMATGVQRLVADAQLGRERVQRASDALIAIAEDVKTTSATIQVLSSMSNDIGNFVHTTSRIARQTHVLALNAAIEAAHSGSGNEGFSAVSEEVRILAATSSGSAREAAELIDAIQTHIGTVARSMGAGEEQVRDVGVVAGEAKGALDALVAGASDVSELVRTTADISRSQATRMSALSEQMSEIAAVNARTSADAQGAAQAMGGQRLTMEDLNKVATQLAGLAERLADSVDRFQVAPPVAPTAPSDAPVEEN